MVWLQTSSNLMRTYCYGDNLRFVCVLKGEKKSFLSIYYTS